MNSTIQKIFVLGVFFLVIAIQTEALMEKYYRLDLVKDQTGLRVENVKIIPASQEIIYFEEGEYRLELKSDERILATNFIELPLVQEQRIYPAEGSDEISFIEAERVERTVFLPYHPEAKKIDIYQQDNLTLSIPLDRFSPQRARETDQEFGSLDSKKEAGEQTAESGQILKAVFISLGILIIILIVSFLLVVRKNRSVP